MQMVKYCPAHNIVNQPQRMTLYDMNMLHWRIEIFRELYFFPAKALPTTFPRRTLSDGPIGGGLEHEDEG